MADWNKEWQSEEADTLIVERRQHDRAVPAEGTHVWVKGDIRVCVQMLDESESGIGVLLPLDTSFAFGPEVHVYYLGAHRVATVVHLTRVATGFRLGLAWKDA